MTGNKRFKQSYVCGDYGLIDNAQAKGEQWIDLHSMGENGTKNVQICIDIMNDFADENEQLKQENNKWIVDYNGLNTEYQWLKEENNKLNSILEEMKDKNGEIWLMDGRIIRLKKVLKGDLK